MAVQRVELAAVDLPAFGTPSAEPLIPAELYEARIAAARERAAGAGFDALLVYGDREHAANLAYLTGYDPRFEEALLALVPGRPPTLLVGNEGMTYSKVSPLRLERVLYQTFSLPGQPRSASRPLASIFDELGLRRGQVVGVAGWKYFVADETPEPERWIEVPAFLVETLRGLGCEPRNATRLFMDPESGLRALNEVEQLARFEFAATWSSQGVLNVIRGARPGMSELDAASLMGLNGIPLSCHPVLVAGPRTALFIPSPSAYRLREGDPIFCALGLWGGNTARAGFLAGGPEHLPDGARDYVARLVAPYFQAIAEWYEAVGIGVTGGALFEIIRRRLGDPFFGVGLNPGHLIHLDEWVSSPIAAGSAIELRSGMALQVDVIPLTHSSYHMANVEDGIALADAPTRATLAARFPETWARIAARREFMQQALGIRLKPEVLPFSNMPGFLPPYWLAPHLAMRVG